jgi:predicted GIY-YIG superfamily endonuclease
LWGLHAESLWYAISREKEIKKWTRKRKEALIHSFNPGAKALNDIFFDKWPPGKIYHRKDL